MLVAGYLDCLTKLFDICVPKQKYTHGVQSSGNGSRLPRNARSRIYNTQSRAALHSLQRVVGTV